MFKKALQALGLAKKEIVIEAPCAGQAISIHEVSDPAFSQEILGTGVAIVPTVGELRSPVDGAVETMFDTGHAVSLLADSGAEVLLHVGLDTVALKGKHYTIHAKNGQRVSRGDLLIEFDIEGIKADGYDIVTPVVICNSDEYEVTASTGSVAPGDTLLVLKKK